MAKIFLRRVQDTSFCEHKGIKCYFNNGYCTVVKDKRYNCWPNYVFIRVLPENDYKIPE